MYVVIYIYIYIYIYTNTRARTIIYIYIYICICVLVCIRGIPMSRDVYAHTVCECYIYIYMFTDILGYDVIMNLQMRMCNTMEDVRHAQKLTITFIIVTDPGPIFKIFRMERL